MYWLLHTIHISPKLFNAIFRTAGFALKWIKSKTPRSSLQFISSVLHSQVSECSDIQLSSTYDCTTYVKASSITSSWICVGIHPFICLHSVMLSLPLRRTEGGIIAFFILVRLHSSTHHKVFWSLLSLLFCKLLLEQHEWGPAHNLEKHIIFYVLLRQNKRHLQNSLQSLTWMAPSCKAWEWQASSGHRKGRFLLKYPNSLWQTSLSLWQKINQQWHNNQMILINNPALVITAFFWRVQCVL